MQQTPEIDIPTVFTHSVKLSNGVIDFTGYAQGVYTLDVVVDDDRAYEAIIAIGDQTNQIVDKEITRVNSDYTTKIEFVYPPIEDSKPPKDIGLPYCDLVADNYKGTCGDRQDYDEDTGLSSCRDGSKVKDYRDCKDAGQHPDEQKIAAEAEAQFDDDRAFGRDPIPMSYCDSGEFGFVVVKSKCYDQDAITDFDDEEDCEADEICNAYFEEQRRQQDDESEPGCLTSFGPIEEGYCHPAPEPEPTADKPPMMYHNPDLDDPIDDPNHGEIKGDEELVEDEEEYEEEEESQEEATEVESEEPEEQEQEESGSEGESSE